MIAAFSRLMLPLALLTSTARAADDTVSWQSPDGRLTATLEIPRTGTPTWRLAAAGQVVLPTAPLGLRIDGIQYGPGSTLEAVTPSSGQDVVAQKGVARPSPITWNGRKLELAGPEGQWWTLEARLFDGGFAWRYIVAGEGERQVEGETGGFHLPEDSTVWLAERPNDWKLKSYAGTFMRVDREDLPDFSPVGPVQGPPLVAELPNGSYALFSEAALSDYSGLRLRAEADGLLLADVQPFTTSGPITSPWRVALYARDLDALVNNRVIPALNPAPDPELFADTDWIHYGKAVWRWWSSGTGTPEEERAYLDYAARLGFTYALVDDGWKDWDEPWQRVAELADYGRKQDVRVLIWCAYADVADPAQDYRQLRDFLDRAAQAGSAGVKLDFFNAETKDRIDFEHRALEEAARRQLVVIFHGLQKPSGEARTYPNEVTREGIRGAELNHMAEGPVTAEHNTALPFTRFVVGAGDYTPLALSAPGETTWSHQAATLVAFTSPVQVLAEDPRLLLEDPRTAPALPFIREVPTLWDETRVLPGSEIGERVVMARRDGAQWWLAILNDGPTEIRDLDLSFLGSGTYTAQVLTSPEPHAFAHETHKGVDQGWHPCFRLTSGDGVLIRFIPQP
ncbi:MAG: alpha-glucosidase [Puniceicoccaceae bacterium 5H]|nr:MAG: alpha-glucosidase [Puniceicoccaceae bacterium 5H]